MPKRLDAFTDDELAVLSECVYCALTLRGVLGADYQETDYVGKLWDELMDAKRARREARQQFTQEVA